MKLKPYKLDGEIAGYYHWCPACNEAHGISIKAGQRPRWMFNGNLDKPTFTPSVRCFTTEENGTQRTICHYFITNGEIVFCGDNPHALNGKTVALPDYPVSWE